MTMPQVRKIVKQNLVVKLGSKREKLQILLKSLNLLKLFDLLKLLNLLKNFDLLKLHILVKILNLLLIC